MGPPNGNGSNSDESANVGADVGLTLADLGLQGADKLTENVKAPPNVNLSAVGALSKGVTFVGLGISGYQTVFGPTQQARDQAAQDTAINAFGLRFPAAAPFTTIPYDLGRMGRELYDAWKQQQGEKFLDSIAQCHGK